MSSPTALPPSFARKKQKILLQLAVPAPDYDDLSPKGSIDEGIRDLINEINACEGFVTTSSCAGRVSVFVEGQRRRRRVIGVKVEEHDDGDGDCHVDCEDADHEVGRTVKLAGVGGKGGGGRWLLVSHDPVDIEGLEKNVSSFLGMERMGNVTSDKRSFVEERLIHFKFEPMILHILTASLAHAQSLLSAALQAGFRESGALNLTSGAGKSQTPMVAIRSIGLGLESVIGRLGEHDEAVCIVSDAYLEGLLAVANDRFIENSWRITRFREFLRTGIFHQDDSELRVKTNDTNWEDASLRRERKRAEGLERSQELKERTTDESIIEDQADD